jgi:flagellar M-ring protein FliF
VTANAVLNFDQVRTTERKYVWDKNTPPVSQSQTKQTYKGAGSPPGGVAGTNGSGTDTSSGSSTGAGKYTNTSNVVNNALGTVTQTKENAPGTLEHLNVAVSLDKSVQGLDVPAITKLVKSGVGFDPNRDKLSVQAVAFDNSQSKAADDAAAAAAKAASAQASHDRLVSMIKTGALGLLVLLLIVTAFLASRKRRRRDEDDGLALLDPVDDEPQPSSAMELQNTAAKRRSLIAAADNQPDDFAKALSGWLSSREN